MRTLDFSDGFESESTPSQGATTANSLPVYVDDAAYVTAKGSAAAAGDLYFNSTSDLQRHYDGTSWVNSSETTPLSISSVLATGTNVTATPTALGEYRTYKKDASDTSGTDDAPTVAPSASNGMLIFANKDYATTGDAGDTNRWEIFVGVNKKVSFCFFNTTGKTGWAWVDYHEVDVGGTITTTGLLFAYDPTTGVCIIDGQGANTATDIRRAAVGAPTAGGSVIGYDSVYFEIDVW